MKNFTIGLNVVLVIAVAVLFYLHFSSGSKDGKLSAAGTKDVPQGDFKIAYFEIDSIEAHFDYYKEVSNSIQSKAQENSKLVALIAYLQRVGVANPPPVASNDNATPNTAVASR